ncbi:MAG: DNA (cytosine-5-)-methyltransferase [Candidatus Thiodiazotropha endolucinida]
MKVLDLFSGIGGFSLGLERAGMKTVAFCEIEEYPRQVLKKHWPDVPIFEDVRKLKADDLQEQPDVIVGGYPCQPFSLAGKRRGQEDDRHLWPEMFRLLQETRARWLIGENVAGHISMGLDKVLSDLESENYESIPLIIPACGVDAPHRRDRLWIIAHSNERDGRQGSSKQSERSKSCRVCQGVLANTNCSSCYPGPQHSRREEGRNTDKQNTAARPMANTKSQRYREARQLRCKQSEEWLAGSSENVSNPIGIYDDRGRYGAGSVCWERSGQAKLSGSEEVICNTNAARPQERKTFSEGEGEARRSEQRQAIKRANWWPAEPPVGRVAHGISRRVDRLKCLGNAVVPQIPEMIGRAIMAAEGF